jgi:peroxiredoxin Q/BCP
MMRNSPSLFPYTPTPPPPFPPSRNQISPLLKGTKQACLFRDNHASIKAAGFSIYGLSTDSPKANTTFQTKQKLSYPLLCDTGATLIGALGFKKAPKGTTRGVFVVGKDGKVLLLQAGGPDGTVEAVKGLVAERG